MSNDNQGDGAAPRRRRPGPQPSRREPARDRWDDSGDDPRSATVHPTRAERLAAQTNKGVGRAYGLTALGTVLPGAGLVLTRRRLIGVPLLILALGSGLAVLYYLFRNGAFRSALDLAARPELLKTLAIVMIVGGVIYFWQGEPRYGLSD